MEFLLGMVAGIVLMLIVSYLRSRPAAPAPTLEAEAESEQSTATEEMPAKRDVVVGSANNGRSNKTNGVTDQKKITKTTVK